MADGITVLWRMNTANGGLPVSLCDGPQRGANLFMGPRDSGGDQFDFPTQEQPGLRVDAKAFVPRGNASISISLRVLRECSSDHNAFFYAKIWPSQLARQADLQVTRTSGGSTLTYFLRSAVLQGIAPVMTGITVDFTFRFAGGLWTTTPS